MTLCQNTGEPNLIRIKCKACDDESVVKWSCKECKENICDLCYKAHIRVKMTKHHALSEF